MINTLLGKVFGTKNEREVKRLMPKVEAINALEPQMRALTDEQLRAKTDEFRRRIQEQMSKIQDEPDADVDRAKQLEEERNAALKGILDEVLAEAFAVCREAGRRVLNMRHFDVQLIGGMVLHDGKIAEMKTGEGKTLVATLPVYLNALSGRGVHGITVNDYLAKRDLPERHQASCRSWISHVRQDQDGAATPSPHCPYELLEQIEAVLRTRAGFGMKLDAERRAIGQLDPAIRTIEQ